MAYKLRLQVGARIHNVFHVSQLKLFHGQLPQAIQVPPWLQGTDTLSDTMKAHEAILDRRIVKVNNKAQTQYLIKWTHTPVEDSSWMVADTFAHTFPDFQTET